MKLKGYLLAVLSAVTYGMIPLFAIPLKQIYSSFDTVLFYRFLFSALLIGAYLLYKKVDLRVKGKDFGVLVVLGGMFGLSSHFLFWGYDYMSAGVASTILFLYPILVACIMGVGFGEKISWMVWLGIVLSFIGVKALNGSGDEVIPPVGIFIVFLSALAYALYMVVVNKSRVKDMDGAKITFYVMLVCAVLFLSKALVGGTFQPIPSVEIGVGFALFALVTAVMSLLFMVHAIRIIGPTMTAILGSMEPIVAVLICVFVFNEPFTDNLAIGILLIITAVMLTVLSDIPYCRHLLRRGN